MCGRFTVGKADKLEKRFKTANKLTLFEPSYNVAPSQTLPIITRNSPNKIMRMKWGFIWSKEGKQGIINLRRDSFKEKPFFKRFLINNRCIIPADGFYEWGNLNLEGKEEKYPFYFYLKDRELFGFAGVYNKFDDAEGKTHYFFAIITTEPNNKIKKVHHRMPAILQAKYEDAWLNPDNQDFEALYKMLSPYPVKDFMYHPVSKRVNSPKNDDEKLIEPLKQ